jgi:hypothetical protein
MCTISKEREKVNAYGRGWMKVNEGAQKSKLS